MQHDYEPVFTIARDILCEVTRAGRKTAMFNEAVAGIIEQSRDAAEQYATAGADYAGELFNRIMHDRASDGAYFTRPEAGALLAGLALHATDETDFTNGKIVDRLPRARPCVRQRHAAAGVAHGCQEEGARRLVPRRRR